MAHKIGDSHDLRLLTEDQYEIWDGFCKEASGGGVYAMASYLDILCRAAGGRFKILASFHDGSLEGGITLYEQDTLYGKCVASRLLLQYNGLIFSTAISPGRKLEITGALCDALSRTGHARLSIRNQPAVTDVRPFLDAGWRASPFYTIIVPLEEGHPPLSRFDKNLRRLVRRACESGLSCTEDDDFESLFRLHQEIHERKSAPLYLKKQQFAAYLKSVLSRKLGRLFHARTGSGASQAALLVLTGGHKITHSVCAAAAYDGLKTGASPFLRSAAFELLLRDGSEGNDLTDASLNSVTRFKSQLGGDLRVCLRLERVNQPLLKARLLIGEMLA